MIEEFYGVTLQCDHCKGLMPIVQGIIGDGTYAVFNDESEAKNRMGEEGWIEYNGLHYCDECLLGWNDAEEPNLNVEREGKFN